ncbi:TetR family transcriptional regulator [Advenella kashmirensis W13003]|uniref:TetR family transcriptional regulator n=1 Tax=Advenella kashmirensis W13003 TaxID=1424334 RepID=V8QYH2_9BURK|nr:TetR/AcrR family transcriptional regulator [Advenella kashmirensis]ETF04049.1 TetR family transcriptional regulator [Advenella kashmirensis W13003]
MVSRGRPRSFDRDAVLRAAMGLFQVHGYEGTSMADLTAAMGIPAPSLYNAFGSKEGLFKEAVEYYVAHDGDATTRALREQPTARSAIETMLRSALGTTPAGSENPGCLVVLGATNCAEENRNVSDFLKSRRLGNYEAIHQRILKGQAEKEISKKTDTAALASFYTTVMNGLAIQIRDGVPHAALEKVVETAMAAWPGKST